MCKIVDIKICQNCYLTNCQYDISYSRCILFIHSKILFYETGKVRGEEFNN